MPQRNQQQDYGSRLGDYAEVATRIRAHRDKDRKYPDGSFQSEHEFVTVTHAVRRDKWEGGKKVGEYWTEPMPVTYVLVTARFYRTPDDLRPGVGKSWLMMPGLTPYTRGSELENAETSAWGRALVAALAADTKKSVASADEVQAKEEEQAPPEGRLGKPGFEDRLNEVLWGKYEKVKAQSRMEKAWPGCNGDVHKMSRQQQENALTRITPAERAYVVSQNPLPEAAKPPAPTQSPSERPAEPQATPRPQSEESTRGAPSSWSAAMRNRLAEVLFSVPDPAKARSDLVDRFPGCGGTVQKLTEISVNELAGEISDAQLTYVIKGGVKP